MLFINKQLDNYEKVLQSDIFREATKEEQGDNMRLMTKEQYEDWINRLDSEDRNIKPQWSQPMYICPKCGGGMCKNLWTCRSLAVTPPITEYEFNDKKAV